MTRGRPVLQRPTRWPAAWLPRPSTGALDPALEPREDGPGSPSCSRLLLQGRGRRLPRFLLLCLGSRCPIQATTSPHPRGTAPSVQAQGPVRTCWPLLGYAGRTASQLSSTSSRVPPMRGRHRPRPSRAPAPATQASCPRMPLHPKVRSLLSQGQNPGIRRALSSMKLPCPPVPHVGCPRPWASQAPFPAEMCLDRRALRRRAELPEPSPCGSISAHGAAGARLKGGACEPACRKCSESGLVTGPGVCSLLLQEPGPGTREATLPHSTAPALGVSPVLRGGEGERWGEGKSTPGRGAAGSQPAVTVAGTSGGWGQGQGVAWRAWLAGLELGILGGGHGVRVTGSPGEGALATSGTGWRVQTSRAEPRPGPRAPRFSSSFSPCRVNSKHARHQPPLGPSCRAQPHLLASAPWSARRGAPRRLWQVALCDTGGRQPEQGPQESGTQLRRSVTTSHIPDDSLLN